MAHSHAPANANDAPLEAEQDRALEIIRRVFAGRRIKRVLLVSPPDVEASLFNFGTCKRGRYTNYEPYGLGVIATHLRAGGVAATIINLNSAVLRACHEATREEDFDFDRVWTSALAEALEKEKPDLVGVTCMFTQTHPIFTRVCREIKRIDPDLPLAVGGVHVTNSLASPATRRMITSDLPGIDFLFNNECDVAFNEFVGIVNGTHDENALSQVSVRDGEDLISIPRLSRPTGASLDMVPSHDLMRPDELSRWGKVGSFFYLKPADARFATVLSNRGCRAQCSFCSVRNFNGVGVRRRSVDSVIDELKLLRNEYGIDHVMWLDDDFLYDRNASLELFNAMSRENLGLTWDCTNGVIAASCTEEIVAAAAASGCIGMSIGMESGNRDILRRIRKPGTVENFLKAAEVIRRYPQIYSRVFLIIGFPHETFAQINDTVSVATEMGLDWYQIQVLQPLPNTPIFDSMVEEGLISPGDFENVRYSGGVFGKNAKRSESGRDMLSRQFEDLFQRCSMDSEPSREELDDAWAYMVFHLNYKKLEHGTSDIKLKQYLKNLEYISDYVAPNDGFALYWRIRLQERLGVSPHPALKERLGNLLDSQIYWKDRFDSFKMQIPA